ncbi:hypothetical protein [Paenibacillus sp. UNC451MF]|uniref:hypothetical protein n=1 Tax=Paenibacillus sp. UNC451MF TaxID=1449063 RepID=UPI00048D1732|nr:hypothetical protein [Paenibacillus sp. UNC451MF]
MLSRDTSSNRWLSLILIVVFMLFATPTPSLESNVSETARTSVQQGVEYFTSKATVRKQNASSDSMRWSMFFSVLSFLLISMSQGLRCAIPETHVTFQPLIARRLIRQILSPIKFTSLFV